MNPLSSFGHAQSGKLGLVLPPCLGERLGFPHGARLKRQLSVAVSKVEELVAETVRLQGSDSPLLISGSGERVKMVDLVGCLVRKGAIIEGFGVSLPKLLYSSIQFSIYIYIKPM